MSGIHDFGLFVLTGVLLNLTPGQDTLYIIGRSLAQGRRAGIASALGITAGSIVHTVAAALGLSALLATSSVAFAVVKWIGAAYLVWLGARLLFTREGLEASASAQPRGDVRRAFIQGMLTNLFNPKVALFFLAFLPQFIDAASPHKVQAFLLLGCTFITTGTLWCLVLALAAARIRGALETRQGLGLWLNRAIGGVFVALGVRLAAARAA